MKPELPTTINNQKVICFYFRSVMLFIAFGMLLILGNVWRADKVYQLIILLSSIAIYLLLFLFLHFAMQQFADKNPVITCYQTYLGTDKKVKLDYTQIKEIHQEVRVRGKSYETFLFINHQLGILKFNETYMESGYSELKHLLENISSASHIAFASEKIDERWLSKKTIISRPRSFHTAKDHFSKIDKGEKAYGYY